jgi:PleD family two-component response regulator
MEGARLYADRVRDSLARQELPTGERITVSAGVAVSKPTMATSDDLVHAADAYLYAAKAAGGNRVEPTEHQIESPATPAQTETG